MKALKPGGDFIYTVVHRVSNCPTIRKCWPTTMSSSMSIPPMGAMKLVGFPVKLSETPGNPLGHAPELGSILKRS